MDKKLILLVFIIFFVSDAHAKTPEQCLEMALRNSISIKFLSKIKNNNGCDNLKYEDLNETKVSKKKLITSILEEIKANKKILKSNFAEMEENESGELSAEEICPYIEAKLKKSLTNAFDYNFKDDVAKCAEKKENLIKGFETLHSNIDYISADLSSVCLDLKTTSEKFEASVKNCSTTITDTKPACEKAQVVGLLAALIAKDEHKILNQQRKLTLLKLAQATSDNKSKSLEAFINKKSKQLSALDHAKVQEDLVRLYQTHGKFDDIQNLKKLVDKNDFSYWNKRDRLQDKDLSILVMAQRTGIKNSVFTEADSAIIWANSMMTEQLPLGSSQSNRLLLSGEVARLRGSISGHSEIQEADLKKDLDAAQVDLDQTFKEMKEEMVKDPALANCVLSDCMLDGAISGPSALAEAMMQAVGRLKAEDLLNIQGKPFANNIVKIVAKKTKPIEKSDIKLGKTAELLKNESKDVANPIDNTRVKKPQILRQPASDSKGSGGGFGGFGGGGFGGGGAGASW